ncbi:MAG: prolipoprotein diacylglyceryl transferase [Saprospiraceae bacterium]|nr:prolipoprotein diacylglyceryl transferase [Saprospiraceae bacterium]
MNFPIEITLGPLHLNLHFVFEILAFFVGYRYFLWLRQRTPDPLPTQNRMWAFVGAAGGALLGSRLLGALEDPTVFFSEANSLHYVFQSKTIVGGLLGGLAGVEAIKWAIGERQSSGDLFTYPLILGMILGRIGCFTMGVNEPTFGYPTDLPWALDLGDGIPRHPTALYEIGFLALLWMALRFVEKKVALANGTRFKLFMVSYLCWRLAVGFIQPGWRFGFGLTVIQAACLVGLGYYGWLFFRLSSIRKSH